MLKRSFVANVTGLWTIKNGNLEAPVTMMVEGVHAGSDGPIYWPFHVLRVAAPKWAGVPVCLNHPLGPDGRPISINANPQVRASAVGTVADPRFCEVKKALKATIRVPANHPRVAEIQNIREVSVGVFTENTSTYGEWDGEAYSACAITMEPDHLALLPDEAGACSWEDGCGIGANSNPRGGSEMVEPLLPTGMNVNAETAIDLAAWEKADLLPPMAIHVAMSKSRAAKGEQDSDEMLLPPGVGR